MDSKKTNRILARVVAQELTIHELDGAAGGWGWPVPRPRPIGPSSSFNTSTEKRHDPFLPEPDMDGGRDD
jgi:hypothetical protein